jgi:hypothetical protein
MKVSTKLFRVLALSVGLGCSDHSGVPATGAAASPASAGASGVAGSPNTGGAKANAGASAQAGSAGLAMMGASGASGSSELGSDVCARAPVDSCDLLAMCESVKARRNCSAAVQFVACAPKQRTCDTNGYCAKDMNGVEWSFSTSCGQEQIQAPRWTRETSCSCSEADAGM